MSRHLERQALALESSAVVLAAFQTTERFTPATIRRYEQLASQSSFVAAIGVGMSETPASGVRGGSLVEDDPLVDEWAIAVVGRTSPPPWPPPISVTPATTHSGGSSTCSPTTAPSSCRSRSRSWRASSRAEPSREH